MNSRDRVLQSLQFEEPDRVPVDFGGHRSSGIMAIAYRRLREYLGLPERLPRVYDIPQQLAVIDDDVLERFGVDTIELGRGFCRDERDWQPWVLPDGTECRLPAWARPVRENGHWVIRDAGGRALAMQKKGVLYFEQTHWPLKGVDAPREQFDRIEELMAQTMWGAAQMAAPPGPVPMTDEGARFLREGAQRLRRSTDRAILGLSGCSLFENAQYVFGMEDFYVLLAAEPAGAHEFLDRLTDLLAGRLEWWLKAVGDCVDIVVFSDDLGTQRGPQISPRMYREFLKPRHERLWRLAKRLAPAKVMLHSCGAISELMDDFIEAGLDATNPVQIACSNMAPESLKARFGGRLHLWGGGCDTQQVLRSTTPAEIREHVRHNLDILAPGGGFTFQQVHNIMADIPPENIVAMFDAVAEWNGQR